ncbi:unnamed protein product [Prorocentrum cordatum]|uniref:Uncharacterized protein n=1 Tax=Prorocentrum cordatum TaxID=2364126 RepID=A0ABN9U8U5_9DINO|nr:unnamed protein product [Polarella glacialis]
MSRRRSAGRRANLQACWPPPSEGPNERCESAAARMVVPPPALPRPAPCAQSAALARGGLQVSREIGRKGEAGVGGGGEGGGGGGGCSVPKKAPSTIIDEPPHVAGVQLRDAKRGRNPPPRSPRAPIASPSPINAEEAVEVRNDSNKPQEEEANDPGYARTKGPGRRTPSPGSGRLLRVALGGTTPFEGRWGGAPAPDQRESAARGSFAAEDEEGGGGGGGGGTRYPEVLQSPLEPTSIAQPCGSPTACRP